MKFLDLSNVIAGVRRLGAVKNTFLHLQESSQEIVDSIARALLQNNQTDIIILYGCINSGSGTTYTISAGAVYYQGEIYQVPAFNGVASGSNIPVINVDTITYRSGDPVVYSDGNTFNTHGIRTMVFTFGLTGTGLADFASLNSLAKPKWTNLTLINGWTNSGLNPVRYRINAAGRYYISGVINSAAASSGLFANLPNLKILTSYDIGRLGINHTDNTIARIVVNGNTGGQPNIQVSGYAASKLYDISCNFQEDEAN